MFSFIVNKKELTDKINLLAAVSSLKSLGASPAENSCFTFNGNTLSLSNNNEANGIIIENIPISEVNGEIIEKGLMINTKKFASIIKGCGDNIKIIVNEQNIIIGEGKRKYELSLYSIEPKTLPSFKLNDKPIDLNKVTNTFKNSNMVTENYTESTDFSGTFFRENKAYSSDRSSVLVINDAAIESNIDLLFATDLFSVCLNKISDGELFLGLSEDKGKIVLNWGNVYIYKTLLHENYKINAVIGRTKELETKQNFKVKLSLKEFTAKLKEIKEIVEAEEYTLAFTKDTLTITNRNLKSGTDGSVVMDIVCDKEVSYEGKFTYLHLNILTNQFSEDEIEWTVLLEDNEIERVAVITAEKIYYFIQKH